MPPPITATLPTLPSSSQLYPPSLPLYFSLQKLSNPPLFQTLSNPPILSHPLSLSPRCDRAAGPCATGDPRAEPLDGRSLPRVQVTTTSPSIHPSSSLKLSL